MCKDDILYVKISVSGQNQPLNNSLDKGVNPIVTNISLSAIVVSKAILLYQTFISTNRIYKEFKCLIRSGC